MGEFGNDVFIALFSGLFDRHTAKATASSFPRLLGVAGSMVHVDAFSGVRRMETIASCVVIVHTQRYYLSYLSSGFPDYSADQAWHLQSSYDIIEIY